VKITLNLPRPNSAHLALFSNNNRENPNEFYLLMTFHKSRKGGFDAVDFTVEDAEKLLKKHNENYVYVDFWHKER